MPGFEEFNEDSAIEGQFISGKPDLSSMPEDEDEQLIFTQNVRMMAVNQLSSGGQLPVTDKDQMGVLVKLLDGIDKQVLGKKRIVQGDKSNANTAMIAKALEEFSLTVAKEGTDKVIKASLVDQPVRDPNVFNRDLTNEFTDIEDDEMALDSQQESSEDFFKRIEDQHEELRK